MIFLFVRIFPYLFPLLYFFILKFVFWFVDAWYLWLILLLLLNFFYFFLINRKIRSRHAVYLFWHSLLLVISGFFYVLLLSNSWAINIFLILWSIFYFVYLESIFHYFYQTKSASVFDLKNIISYLNLAVFFILSASLINVNVLLSFPWWLMIPAGFLTAFILIFSQLALEDYKIKDSFTYAFFISLILAEIMGVFIFLPLSFFVSALVLVLAYYLLVSWSILKLAGKLDRRLILRYGLFAIVILAAVLASATWF